MKRIISLLLVFATIFTLCACSNGKDEDKKKTIDSSGSAIAAVKSYALTEGRIANGIGFKTYVKGKTNYGSTSANKNEDGDWEVTLKGSMWGYTDEYQNDLDYRAFTCTAIVSKDGEVKRVSARKADVK